MALLPPPSACALRATARLGNSILLRISLRDLNPIEGSTISLIFLNERSEFRKILRLQARMCAIPLLVFLNEQSEFRKTYSPQQKLLIKKSQCWMLGFNIFV